MNENKFKVSYKKDLKGRRWNLLKETIIIVRYDKKDPICTRLG